MRIVAGDYKGRKLETPLGSRIRPTSEKVKEALFSSIMMRLPDSICVDLFSGTGNLGLEALSRGAKKCYFSDNSKDSLKLIETNIKKCRAEDYSEILKGDFSQNLSKIKEKIDIFFIDPPYEQGLYSSCLKKIRENNLLKQDGILILEHGSDLKFDDSMEGFNKQKEKKYGSTCLSFFVV